MIRIENFLREVGEIFMFFFMVPINDGIFFLILHYLAFFICCNVAIPIIYTINIFLLHKKRNAPIIELMIVILLHPWNAEHKTLA